MIKAISNLTNSTIQSSDKTTPTRLHHTLRNNLRAIFMVAALLTWSVGVKAQDFYVIKAGNNFLAHTGATTIGNATTFNAETCLWTISGNNIIAISPDGTTGNKLYHGGNYYGYTLTIEASGDSWSNASANSNPYITLVSNRWGTQTANYYIRYNNGWTLGTNNSNRGTLTKLTVSDAPNTSSSSSTSYSAPISGDAIIYSTSGNHAYTADISQIITYAQTIRTFSGYANSGTTTVTINKPYPVNSAYTGTPSNVNWSVNPTTYGNINASTGVLTISSLPNDLSSITVSYTAQISGQSITSTKQVNLAKDQTTYESTLVIDDREDHSWSYYSDRTLPDQLRSLNPADIKIIYHGNGTKTVSTTDGANPAANSWTANATGVQVSYNETKSIFIYHKTLERTDGSTSDNPTGRCAYTTIPNPFSKRPVYNTGDARWRGFYAWRIKSIKNGKIYSAETGGTEKTAYTSGNLTDANTLNADETYYFAPTSEYGMEVELEALWARAYVKTGNANTLDANNTSVTNLNGGSYERNFFVITSGNTDAAISKTQNPVTISCRYPDGSTGGSLNSKIQNNFTSNALTKFEYVNFDATTFSANGYGLIVGRGCTGPVANIYGATTAPSSNFIFRVESGKYTSCYLLNNANNVSSAISINATFGSDYDRINNTNTNLTFSNVVEAGISSYMTSSNGKVNMTVLSGTFGSDSDDKEFYMGFENGGTATSQAVRTLNVYGGNFLGGIAGGYDKDGNSASSVKVIMRIRGGIIHRYLYSSGQYSECSGARRVVITGGTFDAWVAGGAFGRDNEKGNTNGDMYIYFGGNANQTNTDGIFGGGYGKHAYANGTAKYTVAKSTVVFADGATTAGSVYGGGNNGYCTDNINVYLTGGHVAGNVFGGANKAPSSKAVAVVVKGGTVNGGVYGGSNQSGAISGNITVDVYGTDQQPSSGYAINQVFGGGNVAAYSKTPTVTVHCGDDISIGELYGGGNQAEVAGTNVTVAGGNRIGYVYGGGRQANVNGNTSVDIEGGTIEHVFGGNNISGQISGTISVNVDRGNEACLLRIGELYGGGNHAASNSGSITIGCTGAFTDSHNNLSQSNRIGYELEGIGDVYGGANEANITGNITLNITSGMVERIFGGNNTSGTISGDIKVNINKNSSNCGWYVGSVFGGGNHAGYNKTPAVTITNGTISHSVYGGGNEAGVAGGNVLMNGGSVLEGVYGGCNTSGTVSGDVSVVINNGTIGTDATHTANIHGGGYGSSTSTTGDVTVTIGNGTQTPTIYGDVYGGSALGNVSASNKTTKVWLKSGTVNGCLYGGGLGQKTGINGATSDIAALVNGNVQVIVDGGSVLATNNTDITTGIVFGCNNINGAPQGTVSVSINTTGNLAQVFGGGNAAAYTGSPTVTIAKGTIGSVYGGGLGETARVTGNPRVTVTGGAITGNIYGGGEAAPVTGNPVLTLSGNNTSAADIYGGGKGTTAVVTGNSSVTVSSGTYRNVFGGGEAANLSGSVTVNIQGGTISNDVYGGGALAHTNTANQNGNAITPKTNTTTVNLTGGTMKNVYGGGLGNSTTEAKVYGDVFVNLNKGVSSNNRGAAVTDYLFGCNNVNGTPLGSVTVYVQGTQNSGLSTMLAKNNSSYDMKAIYGGGNLAAYIPAADTSSTHVILKGCRTISSEYVYGGGNAAPVPATDVKVYGTYKVSSIFGGGNGKDALPNGDENPGADVGIYKVTEAVYNATAEHLQYKDPGHEKGDDKYILYGNIAGTSIIGTTNVMFLGGIVDHLFGGSNTKGDIIKQANVVLGDEDLQTCDFNVNDVYGGSNEAYMSGSAAIDMNCIEGMNEIYGGSRMADVNNNVVLTITGGKYGKVFGGNNISGRIFGSITVNIEQTGCLPIVIGELYGGGNQAPYSVYGYTGNTLNESGDKWADPTINIISCDSIGKVFGGGLGAPAIVIGDPHININMIKGWTNGDYKGNGTNNDPHAEYKLTKKVSDNIGVIDTVFGGGNEAIVKGQTTINIGTQTNVTVKNVTKAVYNAIKNSVTGISDPGFAPNDGDAVTKDLTIQVQGANITGNVYGGGNNANVTGGTNIQVGKNQ